MKIKQTNHNGNNDRWNYMSAFVEHKNFIIIDGTEKRVDIFVILFNTKTCREQHKKIQFLCDWKFIILRIYAILFV